MQNFVLRSSKLLLIALFSFVISQQAVAAPPKKAPPGFDYQIPGTKTWTNVLLKGGVKKNIRSMIIDMQNSGYSRSKLDVIAVCQDVGKPLSMDIDQMVRNGQWFQLARITFRSCGSMQNVLFKVLPVKKSLTFSSPAISADDSNDDDDGTIIIKPTCGPGPKSLGC